MTTAIPINVYSEANSAYEDIGASKRSIIPKSLTAGSRKNSPTNSRNHFIPFVQERDHLGRLIRNVTEDSIASKIISSLPRLPIDSVNIGTHSRKNSIDKLPNIYHHNSKSLFKMVENGIKTDQGNDTVLTAHSRVMNYSNFCTSLYRIGQTQDNTLEVQTSPKAGSAVINSNPQSSVLRTDDTIRGRKVEMITPRKSQADSKLPPLSVYHIPDNRVLLGSVTAKSADTLISHDLRDHNSSMGPDTSTIINASAWKYEASQIAKNQDIENLLKRENKAVSLGKLIKVSPSKHIPPIGSYDPMMDLVVRRQKNCVILPEQVEKLKAIKRREAQIEKLELARLKASSNATTAREDDTSDEYYKNLFRGMLKEANDNKKKTKKNDPNKKVSNAKKLDYIVLQDFKQFPTDFEHQINAMKAKLRKVKDQITGAKDFRNQELVGSSVECSI